MGFRNLTRQQAASREAQDDEKQKSRSEHAQPNFEGPQAKSMMSAQAMHLQRTIGNKATIELLASQHEASSIEHTTSGESVQRGFFDKVTGKKKKKSLSVGPFRPSTPAPTKKPDDLDIDSESEEDIKLSGAPLNSFMVADPLGKANSGGKANIAIGGRTPGRRPPRPIANNQSGAVFGEEMGASEQQPLGMRPMQIPSWALPPGSQSSSESSSEEDAGPMPVSQLIGNDQSGSISGEESDSESSSEEDTGYRGDDYIAGDADTDDSSSEKSSESEEPAVGEVTPMEKWSDALHEGKTGSYHAKDAKNNLGKWINPASAESLTSTGKFIPRDLDPKYHESERDRGKIYGDSVRKADWRAPVFSRKLEGGFRQDGEKNLAVKYIENEAERDSYELKLDKSTNQFYWRGKPIDTSKFKRALGTRGSKDSGSAIFVMTLGGKIYVADEVKELDKAISPNNSQFWRFNHSTLVAGEAVAAAGELQFSKGALVGVTDASGHYLPQKEHMFQLLEHFKANGINVDDVELGIFGPDGRTTKTYKEWKQEAN